MEFYTSSSVEVENISMQDVFGHMERDVQTELEHFLQHTEKLDFEIRSAATPGAGVLSVAEHEDVHWLSGVENTNPNLLVNPRTALPVHEEAQKQRAALLRELSPKPSDSGPQLFVPSPAGRNSNKTESPQQLHLQPQVVSEENFSPTKGSALYKVPVLVEHLKSAMQHGGTLPVFSCGNVGLHEDRAFPKPVYSYSCLIAMALKNSKTGSLPVSEIYTFMIENFPYFKTAPGGWKNSVRHNLSLNKCFEKVENPKLNGTRKGCLWALNPARVSKMEEEIAKWKKKDPIGIRNSMAQPEKLELIVQGQAGSPCPNRSTGPKPQQDHRVARSTTAGGIEQSLVVQNTVKLEEVLGGSLKDVNSLDANHTLDPALSELALKNGLWDDDLGAELNLDLPVSSMSGSTNSISGSQINLCSSSLTGVKADSGFGQMMFSPLDLGSPSLYGQIPRTLSAQT